LLLFTSSIQCMCHSLFCFLCINFPNLILLAALACCYEWSVVVFNPLPALHYHYFYVKNVLLSLLLTHTYILFSVCMLLGSMFALMTCCVAVVFSLSALDFFFLCICSMFAALSFALSCANYFPCSHMSMLITCLHWVYFSNLKATHLPQFLLLALVLIPLPVCILLGWLTC